MVIMYYSSANCPKLHTTGISTASAQLQLSNYVY